MGELLWASARAETIARGSIGRGAIQKRSELACLVDLVEEACPSTVVEIGTARGGSFYAWCQAAAADALLVSIDLPDPGYGAPPDLSLLRGYAKPGQDTCFLQADSHDRTTVDVLVRILDGVPVDFLFIDGDHSYQGVRQDFESYSPFVRPGGLVAFHDVITHPSEVDRGAVGFWREVSVRYDHMLFWDSRVPGWGGIGVLRL